MNAWNRIRTVLFAAALCGCVIGLSACGNAPADSAESAAAPTLTAAVTAGETTEEATVRLTFVGKDAVLREKSAHLKYDPQRYEYRDDYFLALDQTHEISVLTIVSEQQAEHFKKAIQMLPKKAVVSNVEPVQKDLPGAALQGVRYTQMRNNERSAQYVLLFDSPQGKERPIYGAWFTVLSLKDDPEIFAQAEELISTLTVSEESAQ